MKEKLKVKSLKLKVKSFNTASIKYLKVVIPRLDRGIQKELDTPIKSEYDMFLLFNCLCNIYVS